MNADLVTTSLRRIEVPAAELERRAAADPARPRWHVTAPVGWLSDPNGLSIHPGPDGEDVLHLFYQANTHAPAHNLMQWGHAISRDLVHWEDLPTALEPGPTGPDALGCWSGVVVAGPCPARHGGDDDEAGPGDAEPGGEGTRLDDAAAEPSASLPGEVVPTMVYSGNSGLPTQQCLLATAAPGDPLLTTWVKDSAGAVITGPPRGVEVTEMRDHSVWFEDGRWWQIMGAGVLSAPSLGPLVDDDGAPRPRGGALCFSSPDLRSWTWEGLFAVGDSNPEGLRGTGGVWECPEITRVGSNDVLNVCSWDRGRTLRSVWMTGSRRGPRFTPTLTGSTDLGENYFYAPQSIALPDGRHVMIGWMQPALDEDRAVAAGWAGSMSVPREVSVDQDGTLRFVPVAEVTSLRTGELADLALDDAGDRGAGPQTVSGQDTEGDSADNSGASGAATGDGTTGDSWIEVTRGRSLDLELTGTLESDGELTVDLLASDDGERRTRLTLRRRTPQPGATGQEAWDGWLELDRSASATPASPAELAETRLLSGEVPMGADGDVDLRLLLDRSSLEVFIGGQPLSARVGAEVGDDCLRVSAHGLIGGRVRAWAMGEAYSQRPASTVEG